MLMKAVTFSLLIVSAFSGADAFADFARVPKSSFLNAIHVSCQDALAEMRRRLQLPHRPHRYSFEYGKTRVRVYDNVKNFRRYGYEPQDIAAAAEAVAMVWQRYSSAPFELKITLVNSLRDKHGNVTDFAGMYQNGWVILVIPELSKGLLSLPMYARLALVGSHEAVHQVQEHRGDPDGRCSLDDPNYPDSPEEHEAWEVSMDVLKAFYAASDIRKQIGVRDFVVPERSSFQRLTAVR